MDRIEVLRDMAENVNINILQLFRLIIEELEMLRGRSDSTERVMDAIRKAQQ